MRNKLVAYITALICLLVADGVWLGLLMREQPLLLPAAAFYLLYPVGLVVFAVLPAQETRSLKRAAILGALFGLLAYGTYDLSNLATLQGWPLQLTLVDMAWGTLLSCGCASAAFAASRAWGSAAG